MESCLALLASWKRYRWLGLHPSKRRSGSSFSLLQLLALKAFVFGTMHIGCVLVLVRCSILLSEVSAMGSCKLQAPWFSIAVAASWRHLGLIIMLVIMVIADDAGNVAMAVVCGV